MSDYNDIEPNESRTKEERESGNNDAVSKGESKPTAHLETEGPQKKDFKVLHEDGSLADLPDNDEEGTGSGDGTVGAG
ncbi:hypothetical protein LX99_01284 [Mucilaginibacter oryzae]|uniref:Uncharacterized protein n=1 Tax=Mucilaginibacter oryzae TaxID=468058 RepID=A0A316HFK8_9SPHI|nr:hypothetical protein [Mucilaginibacter oryzae]PWK78831.1 hypothetical protein LX99_01284 [Mucilaginibacter oryzae]